LEDFMKLHGIRGLALAAVPVVLTAALLGSTASTASARPRQCGAILNEVYTDWGLADIYADEAVAANEHGDWLAWGYYNALAGQYNTKGDELYDAALELGC
jgi:hypothetical protein